MYKLTAVYEVNFSRGLRIKRDASDQLQYNAKNGAFSVSLTLIRNAGGTIQINGEKYAISFIDKMKIAVSRNERSKPPEIIKTKSGGRDFKKRAVWIDKRENDYQKIAITIANRLIRFFKYAMSTITHPVIVMIKDKKKMPIAPNMTPNNLN